jgi:selenoprotein W-related protein
VTLIPSSGGVFEITFGDSLIYSKKATGQFPEPGDIVASVGAE